jgi:hypothetical protein
MQEEDFDEELEDEIEEGDDEEDSPSKDLFDTPTLNKIIDNPEHILKDEKTKERFNHHKQIQNNFNQDQDDKRIHPGFVSSYSFGEKEFERLQLMLMRLDEVAEKVMSYRRESLIYFPEFYSILQNFFYCIAFIVDSTNRKKIRQGFDYVREAVINYTTKNEINTDAIYILTEMYLLLTNIKNFHGLGFSYEKKKGESERYDDAFFKKKRKAR